MILGVPIPTGWECSDQNEMEFTMGGLCAAVDEIMIGKSYMSMVMLMLTYNYFLLHSGG